MQQLPIEFLTRAQFARALGAAAGEAAEQKASKNDPAFSANALDFIVGYIRERGEATGEETTHAAVMAGIKPHDERAFGPIYATAIRRKLIRVVRYVPRVRGHGSMGGKLYSPGEAA